MSGIFYKVKKAESSKFVELILLARVILAEENLAAWETLELREEDLIIEVHLQDDSPCILKFWF